MSSIEYKKSELPYAYGALGSLCVVRVQQTRRQIRAVPDFNFHQYAIKARFLHFLVLKSLIVTKRNSFLTSAFFFAKLFSEPYVDEVTMKVHADVDRASKLNSVLKQLASLDSKFEGKTVEWLLENVALLPEDQRFDKRKFSGKSPILSIF